MFKFIKRVIIVFILLCILLFGGYMYMGYREYQNLISETPIDTLVQQIQSDSDYTSINDVSEDYLHAVVAIEDHRFYSHGGIDFITLFRNIFVNIVNKKVLGGGSTITLQLAKNMYLMDSTSIFRKATEVFLSQDLESYYSKDEILELYINIIYFGDQHYGIKQASEGYFGCSTSNLTLGEASMLAGLPQAPSIYALSNYSQQSYDRQKEVLDAMVKYGYITEYEEQAALNEVIYE